MDWNVIVTVQSGPGRVHQLLGALSNLGVFHRSAFHGVCLGRVDNTSTLLESIREAGEAGKHWVGHIARVIPAEFTFSFTPGTLGAQLRDATVPFIDRLEDGSFCVRLERRGLSGEIQSSDIEREIGEFVYERAAAANKTMRTVFDDPDFIIAAETVGRECGVALLPRALRERYPFVKVR